MDSINQFSNQILLGSIFLFGLGIFIAIIFFSITKSIYEKGLNPIYSGQCGGQFGLFRATFPFVRLSLYEEFLVIRYFPKTLVIKYDNIRILSRDGIFNNGLEIISKNTENYAPPILWTLNNALVEKIITERINKK